MVPPDGQKPVPKEIHMSLGELSFARPGTFSTHNGTHADPLYVLSEHRSRWGARGRMVRLIG